MNIYQVIYISRKPITEANIATNVLKHGSGGLNIDASRIGSGIQPKACVGRGWASIDETNQRDGYRDSAYYEEQEGFDYTPSEKGRWPANIVFSDRTAGVVDEQSGTLSSGVMAGEYSCWGNHQIYGKADGKITPTYYADTGGASRFFKIVQEDEDMKEIPKDLIDYLYTMITPTHIGGESLVILEGLNDHDFSQYEDAQWHGCIALGTPTEEISNELMRVMRPGAHLMLMSPEEEPTGYKGACQVEDCGFEIRDSIFWARDCDPNNPNFMYTPKASRSEREKGCALLPHVTGAEAVDRKEGTAGVDNPRAGAGRTASSVGNLHPTVKPIAIMEWCLRDVPKDATVIDPFLGSGTTGIACLKTGHDFIGIEMNEDYVRIADARIRYWNTEYRGWKAATISSEVEKPKSPEEEISLEDFFGF